MAVSDTLGAVRATARYDSWGNLLPGGGGIPQFGFTGREPDATGLTYFRARYYDPTLGRFTQRDPIGLAGGLNPYTYVSNSPQNFTDPLGLRQAAVTAGSGLASVYRGNNSGCAGIAGMCHTGQSNAPNLRNGLNNLASFTFGVDVTARDRFDEIPGGGRYEPMGLQSSSSPIDAFFVGLAGIAPNLARNVSLNVTKETLGILKEGDLINRVWDSRWTPGSKYSGPYGGSYSPTGSLPNNAVDAINSKGLNVPGVLNNAERGAIYEVSGDTPVIFRTSIGGSAPEIVVAPGQRGTLRLIEESISRIPTGK